MNALLVVFYRFIRCAIICIYREISIDLFIDRINEKKNKNIVSKCPILRCCWIYNGQSNLARSVFYNNTGKNGPSYLARFIYRICEKTKWGTKIILIARDVKYVHLSIYAIKSYMGQLTLARYPMWWPISTSTTQKLAKWQI